MKQLRRKLVCLEERKREEMSKLTKRRKKVRNEEGRKEEMKEEERNVDMRKKTKNGKGKDFMLRLLGSRGGKNILVSGTKTSHQTNFCKNRFKKCPLWTGYDM